MTVMQRLREATLEIHTTFEQTLKIAGPDAGKVEYLEFVQAMYGWLHPFEQRLWAGAWPAEMDPAHRSGKLDWLRTDLVAALGEDGLRQVPVSGYLPPMTTLPERFGTAYVLEGAQLGSRMLAPVLLARLAPLPGNWIKGYGEHAPALWRQFRLSAEAHIASEADITSAAEGRGCRAGVRIAGGLVREPSNGLMR